MGKGHTKFSVAAGFGNIRTIRKRHDESSLDELIEVIGKAKNSSAVSFMTKTLYSFDDLRKENKDVPTIKKALEIEIVKVNGEPPMMSTKHHEQLQNEVVKHLNRANIQSFWVGVGSASTALDAGADVVQLHGEPTTRKVDLI